MILEDVGLDDGVDRTGLLAQPTEDALGQIDVVAGGATLSVRTHRRLDGDGHGRADRLAELAGDAALFAVGIPAQCVQPPETRRQRRLLLGILDRDLAGEQVAPRQFHALEQLKQQEAGKEILDRSHLQLFQMLKGVCIQTAITSSQTSVTGMNTFQPNRMIWS